MGRIGDIEYPDTGGIVGDIGVIAGDIQIMHNRICIGILAHFFRIFQIADIPYRDVGLRMIGQLIADIKIVAVLAGPAAVMVGDRRIIDGGEQLRVGRIGHIVDPGAEGAVKVVEAVADYRGVMPAVVIVLPHQRRVQGIRIEVIDLQSRGFGIEIAVIGDKDIVGRGKSSHHLRIGRVADVDDPALASASTGDGVDIMAPHLHIKARHGG